MKKRNEFIHKIDLVELSIPNVDSKAFSQKIIALPYRGYKVEECCNGKQIVIAKPGGKTVKGQIKKEDIQVFIYTPNVDTLWQISHRQIEDDVRAKCVEDKEQGKKLILLMKRVLDGEEPNDFISEINALSFTTGESPEVLLKAYKWIWGQEDVNYPNGEGRMMSWKTYEDLLKTLC